MTACYSASASAPLHALANSFLGESSFSNKTARHNHLHPSRTPQHHSLHSPPTAHTFPRQQPDHKLQQKIQALDPFEHAWSTSTQQHTKGTFKSDPHFQHHQHHQQYEQRILHHHHQRQEFPDLDMMARWDQIHQPALDKQHQTVTLTSSWNDQFESFPYLSHAPSSSTLDLPVHTTITPPSSSLPPSSASSPLSNDALGVNTWAKEMQQEDDDDEEDEFREEWNNDSFTAAYINSHPNQFLRIQEQEREQERAQRQLPHQVQLMQRPRIRVPGLDYSSPAASSLQVSSSPWQQAGGGVVEPCPSSGWSVDEYMAFEHTPPHHPHHHQQQQHMQLDQQHQQKIRPVHAEDRFLSLVSDLHLAEQIYYPAAHSLATSTDDMDSLPSSTPLAAYTPKVASVTNNAWATEFTVQNKISDRIQQHLGAEWNWQKLFGKDPRRQEASLVDKGAHLEPDQREEEGERLKRVALARLQALFGHLSMTSSTPLPEATSSL